MHISPARRDHNIIAAWAGAVSDAVRTATEQSTHLTGAAPAALVAIVADPGLSINQLHRILKLTHPGTVRLVDRLEELGWVRRGHGTGRILRLEPTRAGRQAERELAAARAQAVNQMLDTLPEADVRALATLVDSMLGKNTGDVDAMRRLCRLCDHHVCTPCPVEIT